MKLFKLFSLCLICCLFFQVNNTQAGTLPDLIDYLNEVRPILTKFQELLIDDSISIEEKYSKILDYMKDWQEINPTKEATECHYFVCKSMGQFARSFGYLSAGYKERAVKHNLQGQKYLILANQEINTIRNQLEMIDKALSSYNGEVGF